jgi:hypothetical protein
MLCGLRKHDGVPGRGTSMCRGPKGENMNGIGMGSVLPQKNVGHEQYVRRDSVSKKLNTGRENKDIR